MRELVRGSWHLGCATIALCAIASAVASAAGAQSGRVIRGVVVDTRDQPVASVAVVAAGGPAAVTDDSGRFRLEIPHRDRVSFDLRRVGFMPSRFGLAAGGDTTLSILLLPSAVQLPAVEVTNTETRPPALAGFEERMRERSKGAGSGHFITAKDVEQVNAIRTTQVLETVPSILIRRVGNDRYAIFGKATGSGGDCAATVYLDGIRLTGNSEQTTDRRGRVTGTRDTGPPIDSYVTPSDIAGIEVYARGMLAPPQFQPGGDQAAMKCAIVVVWTKHR